MLNMKGFVAQVIKQNGSLLFEDVARPKANDFQFQVTQNIMD